jgi:putative transposase
MRTVRIHQPQGQKWSTFLRTHVGQIWGLRFHTGDRSLLSTTLRVLHRRTEVATGDPCRGHAIAFRSLGGTTTPRSHTLWTSAKVIRDNDSKFGPSFARVARTRGIKLLKTPVHAPRANAICERFLRSVRQECLEHVLILEEKQLQRVLKAYVAYFNRARSHQGIGQQLPEPSRSALSAQHAGEKVIALPVMGGLHHDYHWAA